MTKPVRSFLLFAIACAHPLLIAATLEQWRQRDPRWETTSERSLQDLEGCLGSKWAGSLSMKIQAMPIEHGMAYTINNARRDLLVDLTDEGQTRHIKLWLRSFAGITIGAKEHIQKLSDCAHPL